MRAAFRDAHDARFGYFPEGADLVVAMITVEARNLFIQNSSRQSTACAGAFGLDERECSSRGAQAARQTGAKRRF